MGHHLGLLPSSGHHLQLQPAAECLGVCPLVQHDQSGPQGERCNTLTPWRRIFAETRWYPFFILQDVVFFANCPAAPWPQFGEMLSWQFLSATKRGLNDDQLETIAHRLFGELHFCFLVSGSELNIVIDNTLVWYCDKVLQCHFYWNTNWKNKEKCEGRHIKLKYYSWYHI